MLVSPIIAIQSDNSADVDASLVLAAQKDPAMFLELYDRWSAPVYQYAYHRTGHMAGAEDLTSQVFLSAYQALPRYQHRGHFPAWLFTIARNQLKEYYRKQQREVPLEMARHLAAPSDPAADCEQADEIQYLKQLVQLLPKDEQELIRLRYVAGLSFVDMGIALNKRADAVKKSLYRLQTRLQSLLEKNHV